MTLRVLFAPLLPRNPYQAMLMEALHARGADVHGLDVSGVRRPDVLAPVRSLRPHVLHLHWLHHFTTTRKFGATIERSAAFLWRLSRARAEGTRVVVTAHNLVSHEKLHPALEALVARRVLRQADGVIAHGPAAARLVAAFSGRDPERITVVPHGHFAGAYPPFDGDRGAARRALGLPDDAFVCLSLGRVRAYKGLDALVRLFAKEPPAAGALLLIAGKELTNERTAAFAREVAGLPRVRFDAGHVADDKIALYLAAADVCVLPYRDVLTSGAAILAMSFGKAVVAPRIGGLADLLPDAERERAADAPPAGVVTQGSLLYDPGRSRALADTLAAAAAARDRLPAIGAANRARVLEGSWERCADATLALYRRIVDA